jgi:hypothetical protein
MGSGGYNSTETERGEKNGLCLKREAMYSFKEGGKVFD